MTTMLAAPAAETNPAGGAALLDILLVGGGITAVTVAMLAFVVVYRGGGARGFRRFERLAEQVIRVPGWAAIPSLGTIAFAVLAFAGAIWDIGVHIDLGRDDGPFGTAAHYPFLVGLIGVFLMGVLAVGMTPPDERRSSGAAVRLTGIGAVPVGALLILAGGGFALLGFPLDDLWHRLFGQDVTLWGPTHTMFFGGLIAATIGAVILRAEGARAAGREPFGGWGLLRKPLPGVLGGILLFVGAHATDEFNWAVPQYRMVWQPMLLVFFGTLALVVARSLGGRGATLAVLAAYLPLQLVEVGLIGALGTTQPAFPLFVAEALLVEALAARGDWRRPLAYGAVAGAAVGTIGFAAEYAWSHVAMPLPWTASLLPEALVVTLLAGLAAGVLGVLMAQALRGTLPAGRRPLAAAVAATGVALALAVNAADVDSPAGVTAAVQLSGAREAPAPGGGTTRVADVAVRLSRPELAEDPAWAYVLGWQGGGRHYDHLVRAPDGTLRSTEPVPIGDDWKAAVRVHDGRTMLAVPVRMPPDPELDFAGYPARDEVTRPMMVDTELLQLERRDDGPTWAWTPAMLLVMALNLSLMVAVAAASVRSGRAAAAPGAGRAAPSGGRPRLRPLRLVRPLRRLVAGERLG